MKKSIFTFCTLLISILTFGMLALPGLTQTININSSGAVINDAISAYKMLSFNNGAVWTSYSASIFVLCIIAGFLFLVCTFELLQNFDVINTKINFGIISKILTFICTIASIIALVFNIVGVLQMPTSTAYATSVNSIGVSLIIITALFIATTIGIIITWAIQHKSK